MSGDSLIQLFDQTGRRKYLTRAERSRFYKAALTRSKRDTAFCLVLHFTGCRVSEAVELTHAQLDPDEGVIVFRSLKKRRDNVFRAVPVPNDLMERLIALPHKDMNDRLFDLDRTTGWRIIKSVLSCAAIEGIHACPRGLRHGFGVAVALSKVPVTLLQRWMGHARLETTSIYLDVTGEEEREMAARLWK